MDFDAISTARLRLVPIPADTARAIVAGDLTRLRAAEGWPHEDTADGMSMAIKHGQPAGWMVTLDGEVIGDCGTHGPADHTGTVEIGYGLAARYRGRGYGSEVVQAIADWLSGQQGVHTLRASTLRDNAASRRVLEKAGFGLTGFDDDGQAVYERAGVPVVHVRHARPADHRAVSRALGEAFRNDPVVRWLLPDGRRTEMLFHVLARYQHGLHGGTNLAELDGTVSGASLWDPPGYRQSAWHAIAGAPRFVRTLRAGTNRGMALEQVFHRERPPGTFWYLAAIGAARQGRGVGSALLEHRVAAITGPAYLESSNEANIALYERFGFRVTGEIHLPYRGPTCWKMLRA